MPATSAFRYSRREKPAKPPLNGPAIVTPRSSKSEPSPPVIDAPRIATPAPRQPVIDKPRIVQAKKPSKTPYLTWKQPEA